MNIYCLGENIKRLIGNRNEYPLKKVVKIIDGVDK
jgi:hypothetical protein